MSNPRKSTRREDGRKSKTAVDARDAIGQTSESALPPEKPPAPSAKHRLKRRRRAKLLK